MTNEEFIKILEEKEYTYELKDGNVVVTGRVHADLYNLRALPAGVIFKNTGNVHLSSLETLPKGTRFENGGNVNLKSLRTLPEGTRFKNGGTIYLESLEALPEGIKFENKENIYLKRLRALPVGMKFENKGTVWLPRLKALPEGIKFENGRDVNLQSLEVLPEGIKFENGENVYLKRLRTLPKGTRFENTGNVYLHFLAILPEGVRFNNGGDVKLDSLEGTHNYLGKDLELKNIDGLTMIIESRKVVEEYEICKARYFGGGPIEDMTKCYVAFRGGYSAHGATVKEAMEDVIFKYLQENSNVSEVVSEVKRTKKVKVTQYRLLTGACREGCKRFLKKHGLADKDELPLEKVLELTASSYGGERMKELFN